MGEAKRKHDRVSAGSTNACGNCRYYRPAPGVPMGLCRAVPPVPLMLGLQKDDEGRTLPVINTYWPQVPETEWCGHWEVDPTRLDFSSIDMSQLSEVEGTA